MTTRTLDAKSVLSLVGRITDPVCTICNAPRAVTERDLAVVFTAGALNGHAAEALGMPAGDMLCGRHEAMINELFDACWDEL